MRKKIIVITCLIFHSVIHVSAQNNSINNGVDRPKLVVGFVVDQMRWDYLYRYFNRYGNNGFKRLLQNGFSYDNTMIPYTPTVTAAGHTCLYTGSVPAIHGIVGNDWIERINGERMYCTYDGNVRSIGTTSSQGRMSPVNMLTTTIGDELRLATNFKSRVYGIALKDRGGILPAGHSANAAYWFDDSTGNWVTSSYYMNALPGWVSAFNDKRKPDSLLSNTWTLAESLPGYDQSTTDDKVYEKPFFHEEKGVFPHLYTPVDPRNYFRLRQSQQGNTLTLDFAMQLVEAEKLGSTGQTDMLCVSLSSPDYVGHRTGPNSLEIEDLYLRLDKEIGKFLEYLDQQIGKNNYLFFLSADHGAPQVPDFMKEHKLPGGSLNSWAMVTELNKVCSQKHQTKSNLVQSIYEYQVYLDRKIIDSLKLDITAVKNTVIAYLKWKPEVVQVFDYADFDKILLPNVVRDKFINGYYYKRSGDIQFILKPQYTDILSTGTEHGSWYNYDAHIPLIWYGWKVPQGRSNKEIYMTDVAPTIAALLRIQVPNGSVGKVLQEIVK